MKRYFDIKNFNENQDGAGTYRYTANDMSIRQYTLYDSNGQLTDYVEDCIHHIVTIIGTIQREDCARWQCFFAE